MPSDQRPIGDAEARRLRVPKAAELVADLLRRRIIRGELRAGDVLPPEAELTAQLNVARGTLREAIRLLESESLVTSSRGLAGVRVQAPDPSAVSRLAGFVLQYQGTTIADVYSSLAAIEPAAVGRLARHRPSDALDVLDRLVDEAETLEDADEHAVASTRFHERLVELGGGQTLGLFARITGDILRARAFERTERGLPHPNRDASHRGVVDLIRAGDEAGAVTFWRVHLREALDNLGEDAERQVIELYG